METIRKTVKVNNRKINITLTDDFNADEVDVIIMPASGEYSIPQWQIDEVRERTIAYSKNPEIALDFNEVMKEIEEEIIEIFDCPQ